MTHLDLFLQKGPPNGDLGAGIDELRRVILLDGIPSNSDGMVRSPPAFPPPFLETSARRGCSTRDETNGARPSRSCACTSGSCC